MARRKPMRCFRTRGKKGTNTAIRVIRRGAAPTSDEATGHMRMIARPSLGLSVGKVGSVVCACASIPMGRRCRQHVHGYTKKDTTCYTDEWQGYNRIQVVPTTPCVTARKNGRAMMTATASVRCIPTPSKACGQPRAIFCAHFVGSTRSICTTIWPCANIKSISNASVPRLLLGLSLSTDQLQNKIALATSNNISCVILSKRGSIG